MKYKVNAVFELSKHLSGLSEKESVALHAFLSSGSHAETNLKILNELTNIGTESKDPCDHRFLRRSDSNKDLLKFKQRILEFQVSAESRLQHAFQDIHAAEQLKLNRKILAAEIAYENGDVFFAIEQLSALHAKAGRSELLRLQRECSEKLRKYTREVGLYDLAVYWDNRLTEIQDHLERFGKLAEHFNQVAESTPCCGQHHIQVTRDRILTYQMLYKSTGLVKVRWMTQYLRAQCLRQEGKEHKAQIRGIQLLRLIRKYPTVFSNHYYLLTYRFLLENMVQYRRYFILRRKLENLTYLEPFPLYQKFPLFRLYLYEQFRSNRPEMLTASLIALGSDITLYNFIHIRRQLNHFKTLVFFLEERYGECISMINRDVLMQQEKCVRPQADMKTLELICLIETGKQTILPERLECYRKFVSRHAQNEDMTAYQIIYHMLKALLKRKKKTAADKLRELNKLPVRLYDLQPFMINHWISHRIKTGVTSGTAGTP